MHTLYPRSLLVVLITFLILAPVYAFEVEKEPEPWITVGEDGRLVYRTDERGNTIPDFSRCGYRGGGVALPVVPVVMEMESLGWDDETSRVQEALDLVGQMPADEEGRRGALLLRRGVYRIDGTLQIPGGVVLRGEGSDEDGTLLVTDKLGRRTIVRMGEVSDSGRTAVPQTERAVTDSYVPWSARTLSLEFADDLKPGDRVVVVRVGTPEWIALLGMDRIEAWENPSPDTKGTH